MADEEVGEGEASPAKLARVRPLARVSPLMISQLHRLGKGFAALGTLVGALVGPVDLLDVLVEALGHNVLAADGAGLHLHDLHPVL